jgi:hypothetical protein
MSSDHSGWIAAYEAIEVKQWGMTMQITVAFVNPPKEGKKNGSVKVGDRYYSYDPKKFTFAKGGTYDIEYKEDDYNGKTYYFIEKAKEVGTANSAAGDRWWMPFVSNTVAHAIAAGKIEEPLDLKAWALAAKTAATELDAPVKQREPGEDEPDFE